MPDCAYVSIVLCGSDCLRNLLLDDSWRGWAAEVGIGNEDFRDAVEGGKVELAFVTLFDLVFVAERECGAWSTDGEVDWPKVGVNARLHDRVCLWWQHHLGRSRHWLGLPWPRLRPSWLRLSHHLE